MSQRIRVLDKLALKLPPKWLRALFRRRLLVLTILLLQAVLIIYMVWNTSRYAKVFNLTLIILSFFVILYIISKKEKPSYKLMWVMLILVFPLFGGLFYLFFRFQSSTRRFRSRLSFIEQKMKPLLTQEKYVLEELKSYCDCSVLLSSYLSKYAGLPIYKNSTCKYLTPGEQKFAYLKEELKKAEKFIFLEYFIIQEGIMWNEVLEILANKARSGVDVRVIFDDIGCFILLPKNYHKKLQSMGIKCTIFNPFRPMLSSIQNNRDHRKIAVIDGKTAFTGGINLADEYINKIDKHGHWKDAAIMVKGEAVWSFTLFFLQMWYMCENKEEDYLKFKQDFEKDINNDGYVQPYADSPLDSENVIEHIYLSIIQNAKEYLYITTPYLIVEDNITSSLASAAKSGVDVRIITPHQPDKWSVHMTTRSYYTDLLKAGVKIYEYEDGFIHSKTFVSDDKTASVGTANLDYRSLYLHFECGALIYKNGAVMEVKDDFLTILNRCREITLEDCRVNPIIRFVQELLRVFAPLM